MSIQPYDLPFLDGELSANAPESVKVVNGWFHESGVPCISLDGDVARISNVVMAYLDTAIKAGYVIRTGKSTATKWRLTEEGKHLKMLLKI